jgi:hypothetical protein
MVPMVKSRQGTSLLRSDHWFVPVRLSNGAISDAASVPPSFVFQKQREARFCQGLKLSPIAKDIT